MIPNMRPGVFTEYEILPKQTNEASQIIGIIGSFSSDIAPLTIKKCNSYKDVIFRFGENGGVAPLSNTIFKNSNHYISVIGVEAENISQYQQAIELLLKQDNIRCIICDIMPPTELFSSIKEKIQNSNKLFFSGISENKDAVLLAQTINCNRICLSYPPLYQPFSSVDCSPALLACSVIEGNDISINRKLLYGDFVEPNLNNNEIDRFLYYGVTVLEPIGNGYEIIRPVTTQTLSDDGSYDAIYRELDTTLKQDNVLKSLSNLLKQRLLKGEITSEGALLSLIIGELNRMKRSNIITDYAKPSITPKLNNPTAYDVSVAVVLTQSIQQIYLKLNINI